MNAPLPPRRWLDRLVDACRHFEPHSNGASVGAFLVALAAFGFAIVANFTP